MATLALTATIILALSSVAGQWLPNWRRGFVDLQRADLLGVGLERLVNDLSAAEYVTPSAGARAPLFEGDASSVIFVRSAIGPDAYPHLEIVRLAEIKEDRGLAMVRTRARFAPTAPKPPGAPAQADRLRRSCHPRSRALPHFLRLCGTGPRLASELERPRAAARGGAHIGPGHSRQSGASGVDRGAHQGHSPRRAQASDASECGRRSSYGRTAGAAMKTPAMTSLPRSADARGGRLCPCCSALDPCCSCDACLDLFFLHGQHRRRIARGRRPRAGGGLDSSRRRNGGLPSTRAAREGQTGPGRLRHRAWDALASRFAFAPRRQGSTSTPRRRTCWPGYSPQSASIRRGRKLSRSASSAGARRPGGADAKRGRGRPGRPAAQTRRTQTPT